MKISMFITGDAMQFNLEPESEHEREMLAILGRYNGNATISPGVDVSMCRGGYLRNFGEGPKVTAITIAKPEVP